jgi:hypothetical protein
MLKLTEAWRISDGRCFERKMEAYKEQITVLYRLLPKSENKPPIPGEFRKMVNVVEKWLIDSKTLLSEMGDEGDVEVRRSIGGH